MDQQRLPDIYGPGTYTDPSFIPVPQDSNHIFRLLAAQTPGFTQDESLLSNVTFEGEEYPILPGPLKAIPIAAALHGMMGVVASEILTLRGLPSTTQPPLKITINTTHAALWLATVSLAYLDGESLPSLAQQKRLASVVPDWERSPWKITPLIPRATAIYPTKTQGTWYSLHGSLDQPAMLKSTLNINSNEPGIDTLDQAAAYISSFTSQLTPEELEIRNLHAGLCGTICFTPAQWRASAMGRSLASHPLINVRPQNHAIPTPPIPLPSFRPPTKLEETDTRPLAGIKVIELTRIIAGPQLGALLSSFGAEVIRVSAPHLRDINAMQLTLNAGKRTVALDLREEEDKSYLQGLVSEADVFIQGFRPGAMDRWGLGVDDLLAMAGRRGKGIVYVNENCYGPDGVYASRPGWQQMADCASGAAYVTGRALGLEDGECVLPSLPISDMTTGAVGAVGTMLALRDRAVKGGSYLVHAAIVASDVFALEEGVGLYPREVVRECQERFGWGEMRGVNHVVELMQVVVRGWNGLGVTRGYIEEGSGFFQSWEGSAFGGRRLSFLRPVVRFSGGEVDVGPEWKSASVPSGWERKEDVWFRG